MVFILLAEHSADDHRLENSLFLHFDTAWPPLDGPVYKTVKLMQATMSYVRYTYF